MFCKINLICLKALIYCTFPQYSQDQNYPDLLWYLSEANPNVVLYYGNRDHTICRRAAPQCLSCESNSSGNVGAHYSSGVPVFAPQDWGISFCAWLLLWKCSEWKQKEFQGGWLLVCAGTWIVTNTQETEAAGGSVPGRDVPFGAGPCSGRNFPCSLWSCVLCLFSNNFLHVSLWF